MKSFILTLFCIVVIFIVYVWRPSASPEDNLLAAAPATNAADLATKTPIAPVAGAASTPTVTPVSYPTPGAPVRVNFLVGSYGMSLTAPSSTRYLLWAKHGQVLRSSVIGSASVSLYGPDGKAIFRNARTNGVVSALIPADGDHALVILASSPFTVGVEIR